MKSWDAIIIKVSFFLPNSSVLMCHKLHCNPDIENKDLLDLLALTLHNLQYEHRVLRKYCSLLPTNSTGLQTTVTMWIIVQFPATDQ